jgi:hypothetical protein
MPAPKFIDCIRRDLHESHFWEDDADPFMEGGALRWCRGAGFEVKHDSEPLTLTGEVTTDMPFREELAQLINHHSRENGSNTPDYVLAHFLANCLEAFDGAVRTRDGWYGIHPSPGGVDERPCHENIWPEEDRSPGSKGPS